MIISDLMRTVAWRVTSVCNAQWTFPHRKARLQVQRHSYRVGASQTQQHRWNKVCIVSPSNTAVTEKSPYTQNVCSRRIICQDTMLYLSIRPLYDEYTRTPCELLLITEAFISIVSIWRSLSSMYCTM